MNRTVTFCGLVVCASMTWQSPASAINLTAAADSMVSSVNPANNYGGGGSFGISAAGLPKGELQTLLKFDLATAKTSFDSTFGVGGWKLDTLALVLTAANPNNAIFNMSAAGAFNVRWMQNDSWVEGSGTPSSPGVTGVTWNSLPTFLSSGDQSLGPAAFNGATSGAHVFVLNSASGIAGDALAGAIASFQILATDSTMSGVFNSRSFGTVDSRPILSLTAVAIPEPAGGILAACAIGCVSFASRHGRRL